MVILALALSAALLNPAVRQDTLTATVCHPGYTATIRPSTAYTRRIKARLLHGRSARGFVLDHRLSLSLGGHPTNPENLALQTVPEAKRKDVEERRLAHAVCAHRVPLRTAQEELLRRWP